MFGRRMGVTVKAVELDDRGRLRVVVRLRRCQQNRCGTRHPTLLGLRPRGWGPAAVAVLDVGVTHSYLEGPAPRVRSPSQGIGARPTCGCLTEARRNGVPIGTARGRRDSGRHVEFRLLRRPTSRPL